MKAIVSTRYGTPDILTICEVPKPVPKMDEVLIRVCTTTVSRTDCGLLRGRPLIARMFLGFFRPKHTILGMDFAGEVEAVGPGVTTFAAGDRVFGMSPANYGAHAEYICVSDSSPIASIPEGMAFAEAVICEGMWYADTALRAFGLARGHRILIYGASGAIGTAAVQLAKFYGAQVTAVVATPHLDLASSLGADHIVDYTAQDFTKIGGGFDFVFDAVGKTSYFHCRRLLKSDGVFAAADLGPWCQNILLALCSTGRRRRRVCFPMPMNPRNLMVDLKAHVEANVVRAVVDRTYPLDEIADAYRYVETGRKTGIVVVRVGPENAADVG